MANQTSAQYGISLHGTGNNPYENIDTSKTLTHADCGLIQNIIADSVVITLPATAAGTCFTIRNGGVPKTSAAAGTGDNYSLLVKVSPAAADKIQGLAFTAADNKAAQNTKATAQVGDFITIVGDGVDGYNVVASKGIWAREA